MKNTGRTVFLPPLVLFLAISYPSLPLYAETETTPENNPRVCRDGVDNDADGHVDCMDEDCSQLVFCAQESTDQRQPEDTADACQDGADNDGDGYTDCADQDCQEYVFCAQESSIPASPASATAPPAPASTDETPAQAEQETHVPSGGNFRVVTWAIPLEVNSEPSGAAVFIDEEHVGETPWSSYLGEGRHTLTLESEGFDPYETFVYLRRDRIPSPLSISLYESVAPVPRRFTALTNSGIGLLVSGVALDILGGVLFGATRAETSGIVVMGVGGGIIATGIVLLAIGVARTRQFRQSISESAALRSATGV